MKFSLRYGWSTPSPREIDHAARVLGISETERLQMHNYYRLERFQNRAANIAVLKALGRLCLGALLVVAKVALVMLLLYLAGILYFSL